MSSIIFLTPELVSKILECSVSYARKLLKEVRVDLGKKRSYRVSIRKFCEFHGYDIQDFYDSIERIEEKEKRKKDNRNGDKTNI